MNNETLKKKIYKRRKELGYSQEYVAEGIPLSLNAYIKIEKGETRLISKRLERIAKTLDVSIEELLIGPNISIEDHNNICNKIKNKYELYLKDLSDQLKNSSIFVKRLNELIDEKDRVINEKDKIIEDLKAKIKLLQ
jgi:Helix-turn-helix.